MNGASGAFEPVGARDAAEALRTPQSHRGHDSLSEEGRVSGATGLRRLQRRPDAVQRLRVVAGRAPDHAAIAGHLAAALEQAGDHAGAADAARRAIALHAAPESWLVLGRALLATGDVRGAREALTQATTLRPGYVDALRPLSQLLWMSTADPGAALNPLQRALRASPSADLAALTCLVMKDVAGPEDGYAFIRGWTGQGSVAVELAATACAAWLNTGWQTRHAQATVTLAPDLPAARHAWMAAQMARGEIEPALEEIERWLIHAPEDPTALALRRTAWRLAGRPEALTPADHDRLVRSCEVNTPEGWSSRAAWLEALAVSLRRLHPFRAEPFGQAIRAGTRSQMDPRRAGDPVIDATFAAFAAPLADYGRAPGEKRENDACIVDAWSVRLASGGWQGDHVHPGAPVSAVFHVTAPETVASGAFGGWLRFGGAHLGPALEVPAERRVEPRPGRLVLFPSSLWHGAEPCSGAGERLTLGFDARFTKRPGEV